ncbi:MAG: ABC transporter ATP-binding protein [Halobacteria archaeon]|nr:ABC transporter ATP-binding protein [Halobacteria archaeon]
MNTTSITDSVINVTNLSKRFGAIRAVDDISFRVKNGSTTALLGGNGAGKTTTIAMLLGLLLPSSGKVSILGQDMLRHRYRVLDRINFTSPYVDLPGRLSVRENLSVYARLYAVPKCAQRIQQLTEELEITDLLARRYRSLSAGQRTRVSLAKALLNNPRILFLDEPTASLDPDSADHIRHYLQSYQRGTGATLFMASHNMVEVERMCDDVIIMRQGRIIDQDTPKRLISRHGFTNLEQVFLDVIRRTS